jgi:hypothetical protein
VDVGDVADQKAVSNLLTPINSQTALTTLTTHVRMVGAVFAKVET